MKKLLFAALVAVFVLSLVGTAFAVVPSTNIATTTTDANGTVGATNPGAAYFTYKDLQDLTAKTEGGYNAFDAGTLYGNAAPTGGQGIANVPSGGTYPNLTTGTPAAALIGNRGPHGGYSSTSNKCKVCHAVHRAEGAYYLLRADSQDDACDYCHIGGSAHSAKVVYDLGGGDPTAVTNGHTMGASTQIPDSSIQQIAQAVTLRGSDAAGNPITEDINVRSYDANKNEMYRFARHHSQSPAGTGRSGFRKVGPLALRCMNCHQPHNAAAMIWQPSSYDPALLADTPGGLNGVGYKLLRRYPSAATTGAPNGMSPGPLYDSSLAIKVPETTLTAGFNFSTKMSADGVYNENGVTATRPLWIAQGWDNGAGGGPAEDPIVVNQFTLSVWCADCHNLNIGGDKELVNEELGFKAHAERTHPAPFTGSHSGPSQCYACHRNDLSVMPGTKDPAGYGSGQVASPASDSCGQCHYGTKAYAADHAEATSYGFATAPRDSDFPHSGKAADMKMLGDYTASVANSSSYKPVFTEVHIGEGNIDAVCLRCHPGIGVHN